MPRLRSARVLCCLAMALIASCDSPTEVNDPIRTSLMPVAVAGDLTFVSLAAGAWHTCALATTGEVYCWEDETPGSARLTPTRLQGSLTFTALTRSCGLAAAGAVYCWSNRSLPPMRIPGDIQLVSISSGDYSSCGLSSEGVAYCWQWAEQEFTAPFPLPGGNRLASIHQGLGFARTCGLTAAGLGHCWSSGMHEPIPGDPKLSSLGVGSSYQCGISEERAYCWGLNAEGKLGIGTTQGADTPQPVAGQHAFSSISSGEEHTCALTAEGVAYCWGLNDYDQLGYRTAETCAIRVPMHGILDLPCAKVPNPVATELRFTTISAGRYHTCGLTSAGKAYCWGRRALLGNGRRE